MNKENHDSYFEVVNYGDIKPIDIGVYVRNKSGYMKRVENTKTVTSLKVPFKCSLQKGMNIMNVVKKILVSLLDRIEHREIVKQSCYSHINFCHNCKFAIQLGFLKRWYCDNTEFNDAVGYDLLNYITGERLHKRPMTCAKARQRECKTNTGKKVIGITNRCNWFEAKDQDN